MGDDIWQGGGVCSEREIKRGRKVCERATRKRINRPAAACAARGSGGQRVSEQGCWRLAGSRRARAPAFVCGARRRPLPFGGESVGEGRRRWGGGGRWG